MIRFKLIFSFLLICFSLDAQKQITIEDFTSKDTFNQRTLFGLNWRLNGKFYTALSGNKIQQYDVTTGLVTETILDGASLSPSLTIQSYSFSADEKKILLATGVEPIYRRSSKANFLIYDVVTKATQPLSSKGKQSYATFSPDGTKIAFTRENNLFYTDVANKSETQVTNDGKQNAIINGSTDWVYEEELGFAQAFYWSPDSKKIAFYKFDESNVREYTLQKWNKGALYPENYRYKYPKAGEDNSVVSIQLYDLTAKSITNADIGKEKDIYIPRVKWTLDPNILSVRRMNRLQNVVDLLHVNASTGASKVILTEESKTYIDMGYTSDLLYLNDGKQFVVSSERSGFKHFYLYSMDGTLVRPLTSGDWEATSLTGLDEKTKTLFYLSTEGDYLSRSFYSISLDGKKKVKLSKADGNHAIDMSEDFQFYIDSYSSANIPMTVSLYRTKGNQLVKDMETNENLRTAMTDYGIVPKEFFKYTSEDGTTLIDGFLMKPKNLAPGKKYALLVFQYSGPRSNSVSNSFGGGSTHFWHQMLVQKGIVVAVVDTRGTGSRGEKFAKQTYKQLGRMEMEDLVAATRYFAKLDYVDKDRLGIWGWSYGGYTTSLVMTKGAGAYKLGIAGAPVTTWRYYDNIYTERFLQRPKENPSGYDDNSPMTYASKLQGKFLLIHGTGDDNVHFQNSVALEEALINAGKQFRSHFYPDQQHGFRGANVNNHRWTLMTDFLVDNL